MNELQKIEFNLLKTFVEICNKLNLNYFLVCGSALGAARHGGFIPWDDDLDVAMYREDYNKFLESAQELLPNGIFLQNYKTDPQFPLIFSKLRDSNTTYIETSSAHLNINHGVYLDIFPLDGAPGTKKELKKFRIGKTYHLLKLGSAFNIKRTKKHQIVNFAIRLFGCHKRSSKIAASYEKLISKYSINDSTIVCNHGTWYGERDYIAKEYYGNGSLATFEGLEVRVPEKCDEYLTSLYGDWRKLPPEEKQKGHHHYDVCDLEKPYTYYTKQNQR